MSIIFVLIGMLQASDYCGVSDIPKTFVETPPEHVWVFFRHGARTDYHETNCFPNKEQTQFTCSLQSGFFIKSGLVKSYAKKCSVGQLLDYAETQMTRLGKYLLDTYSLNTKNAIYLRSTDIQRTLGSLDLLLHSLRTKSQQIVHTEEFESDPLNLNTPNCPRATQLDAAFQQSNPYREFVNSNEYLECSTLWESEIHTKFSLSESGDCLQAAKCANIDPPIVPSARLSACVESLVDKARNLKFGSPMGQEFCRLATFPILRDIPSRSNALLATHDDTLACLLVSWGLWDGVWPKYAGFVTVEKFENKYRILRDGVELQSNRSDVFFYDEERWRLACNEDPRENFFLVPM